MFLRPKSLVAFIHSTRDPHFQAHTATESPGTKRASISKTSLDHCTRLVLNESRSSSCWILISCWMLKIEPGFPETGNDPKIEPGFPETGNDPKIVQQDWRRRLKSIRNVSSLCLVVFRKRYPTMSTTGVRNILVERDRKRRTARKLQFSETRGARTLCPTQERLGM